MKSTICMLAAAISVAPLPAVAQNAEEFAGLSAGAEIGIQKNKINVRAPRNVALNDSERGYVLRGFMGLDFAVTDHIVLGGEVGLGLGRPSLNSTADTASIHVDPGSTLDSSGQAGIAVNESVLLYGRTGYTILKVDITASNANSPDIIYHRDKRKGGLLQGSGGEWAITKAMTLRVEYQRPKHDNRKSDQRMLG